MNQQEVAYAKTRRSLLQEMQKADQAVQSEHDLYETLVKRAVDLYNFAGVMEAVDVWLLFL